MYAWRQKIGRCFTLSCAGIVLAGCNGETSFFDQLVSPRPWGLGKTPEGSPMFKQGWEDGCDSGLGAYGNDRYKAAYGFKQDPNLINNPEYYRAWKDGWLYCRWYNFGWARPFQQDEGEHP